MRRTIIMVLWRQQALETNMNINRIKGVIISHQQHIYQVSSKIHYLNTGDMTILVQASLKCFQMK